MKKLIGLFFLIQISIAYADDDCPSAADAAEAQNPNAYKNCDYTKTGLNGVLHRVFREKSSASEDEQTSGEKQISKEKQTNKENKNTSENKSSSENKGTKEKSNQKSEFQSRDEQDFLMSAEFSSAQQLQLLRFNLIQKAATECPKGFVLDAERYLPTTTKTIKLELVYRCL